MFHSAHWDHDHDLTGRKVAVLGTGASAIQFVPAIAPQVERLTVFQRSAPWVLPKIGPGRIPSAPGSCTPACPLLHEALAPRLVGMDGVAGPDVHAAPPRTARAMTAVYRTLANVFRTVQLRGDRRLIDGDAAGLRDRLQARADHIGLVSDPAPRQRRPRHRADPRGRRGRDRHRGRPPPSRRTRSCSAPASPRPSSSRRWRSRDGTAAGWWRSGRTAPRPTSASRFPASPTCSCSTGPTPTTAPARRSS